jgi:hypothetical protein
MAVKPVPDGVLLTWPEESDPHEMICAAFAADNDAASQTEASRTLEARASMGRLEIWRKSLSHSDAEMARRKDQRGSELRRSV